MRSFRPGDDVRPVFQDSPREPRYWLIGPSARQDYERTSSFATLAKIRTNLRRWIPVMMFSTSDENLKDDAILRGADSYVPKGSLDWVELLAEVARLAGLAP
jgi:hypothetical protein